MRENWGFRTMVYTLIPREKVSSAVSCEDRKRTVGGAVRRWVRVRKHGVCAA